MQLAMDWGCDGMRIVVLGSGSSGNSMVVESGGRRLLVDAGFSCKELGRRMALRGIDPDSFDAMVITHEHGDHVRGARVFAKRHGVKVYATRGTLEASGLPDHPIETGIIESGHRIELGSFEVEPFNIPHDAREPVGMVVEDGAGNRVGLSGQGIVINVDSFDGIFALVDGFRDDHCDDMAHMEHPVVGQGRARWSKSTGTIAALRRRISSHMTNTVCLPIRSR